MYRAQLEGRCQLHRIYKQRDLQEIAKEEGLGKAQQYSVRWVNQWLEVREVGENIAHPLLGDNLAEGSAEFQTKKWCISWRFVTNGGKDDGIIRPLISGSGLPFYPGSSMKGAFREACKREEQAGRLPQGTSDRYCGQKLKDGDFQPGILRFHGGYPANKNWTQNLVDIVHPQQDFQVKENAAHSAYTLISLYKPEIIFGISTSQPQETNWEQVWEIWKKALGYGIGCRVSSGYGLTDRMAGDVLYRAKLYGQGAASKLIDGQKEFRPNIFRAAVRGHALRIFGGLNQSLAEDIVDELFGGIRSGKEQVGLLGMAFEPDPESLKWDFVNGSDAYEITGKLIWTLTGKLDKPEHRLELVTLIEKLTQFAMLLGGFGKSWRRADHRIFHPRYNNHLIGCHWYWVDDDNKPQEISDDVAIGYARKLIKETLDAAEKWMKQKGFEIKHPPITAQSPTPTPASNQDPSNKLLLNKPILKKSQKSEWREAWQSDRVQVWGRIAKHSEDSKIVPLLHSRQQSGNQSPRTPGYSNQPSTPPNQSLPLALQKGKSPANQGSKPYIYRTCLTGRVKDESKSNEPTQIGRLWHRMYPLNDKKYLEIVTIFFNGCTEAELLLEWISSQKEWQQLW
jgi:CRISPR-associated protein Cmr6